MNRVPIFCISAAAAVASVPQFPASWSAPSYATSLLIFQGASHDDSKEEACCDLGAVQCKIQAQRLAGSYYVDSSHNRTSLVVGTQAEINLFEQLKSIVAAQNADGTWACQSYCPIDPTSEHYYNPLHIDPKAKNLGKTTFIGKDATHYQWEDKALGIKMDVNDYYVDESGSSPVPVGDTTEITPFNNPEIGFEQEEYHSFTASPPPASVFNITGLEQCPQGQDCQSPDNGKSQTDRRWFGALSTFGDLIRKFGGESTKPAPQKKRADESKWPMDFSTNQITQVIQNQGAYPSADGKSYCCSAAGPLSVQCQFQVQTEGAQVYFDYTNQRVRTDDGQQTIVDFYGDTHKAVLVTNNGTQQVCSSYCPINPAETLQGGSAAFLGDNATDKGPTKFENQTLHHWEWKEKAGKFITIQTSDFYAHDTGSDYIPVVEVDDIMPFGVHIADQTTTFSNFQAGPQNPELFDVTGLDSCPLNPNCGQSEWQLHRLARRQIRTYADHLQILPASAEAMQKNN